METVGLDDSVHASLNTFGWGFKRTHVLKGRIHDPCSSSVSKLMLGLCMQIHRVEHFLPQCIIFYSFEVKGHIEESVCFIQKSHHA